jgi:hypothetical protein
MLSRPSLIRLVGIATVAVILSTSLIGADLKVTTGTHYGLRWLLNVHESPVSWIRVGGKKYDAVQGDSPFYLKIPEWNAIFFVATVEYYYEFAHFVFLKDGKDVSTPVPDGFDSYDLGAPKNAKRYVSIDGVQQRRVFISCYDYDGSGRHFVFDLDTVSWTEKERTPAPNAPQKATSVNRHS